MKTTNKILIIDLEATCWDDRPPRGQESEIIEIGVCIMDAKTGKISRNEGVLVKPQYSKVSPFCTELTFITQQMLDDEGVLLEDALNILRAEYDSLSYDHINVKTLFGELHPIRKSVGMERALKELKLPLEGTHHRGVDDVKNIAKILFWCLQRI